MTRVVVTATVKDAEKWEEGFRTHADLFKTQSIKKMRFGINGNEVALLSTVRDMDTYYKVMDSDDTRKAMEHDGVIRETVKIFVIDKKLKL